MGGVVGILYVEARNGFAEGDLLRAALGIGIAAAKGRRGTVGHQAEHEVGHGIASLLSTKEEAAIFQVADVGVVLGTDYICPKRYLVLAANEAYGPVLCFWDEPDNYLALPEIGHFVLSLRKAFQSGGQFIATSHNQEAIRRFSDENTLVLYRKNHLEPTVVRPLSELQVRGDLVGALVRGDVEP